MLNYIYKEYRQKIVKMIKKSGGTDYEAKDIFQVVLIRLFDRLQTKETEIRNFESYIVKASLYEYRKKEGNENMQRETEYFSDLCSVENLIAEENVPYSHEEEEDILVTFLKCFNLLPADCKKIFRYRAKNISYREMIPLMNNTGENVLRVRRKKCIELFFKFYNN
ncbi:MAG: sigma-70 family RNA polymerase sigma factor [Bacteroidota bacterium]